MPNAQVFWGTDKRAPKVVAQIMELYNEHSELPYEEHFELTNPSTALITTIKGCKGGMITEIFLKRIGIGYFAGFPKEHWGKGYLKKCVEASNAVIPFYGAQCNGQQEMDLWKHLGYKYQTSVQMCPTMINIPPEQFSKEFEKARKASGEAKVDQHEEMMKLLARHHTSMFNNEGGW